MGDDTPDKPRAGVTPEVVRPSTAARAAWLMVAIVVGFVALNGVARWYLQRHGTNLGYRMVHAKWQLLAELDAPPLDWLVLGDSSGAHGVVPEVLTEVLGGRAVNLSIVANLLIANDAWMLEEYIERYGAPKNVVLVHTIDIWHRGYKSALIGQIPRPWGLWRRREPRIELTAEHELNVFLSRFVPLYAESQTLRAHVKALGPPNPLDLKMTASGFIPAREHQPGRFGRDRARTERFVDRNRFKLSDVNRRALDRIGALAGKHDFDVYLVHGPSYVGIERRATFQRYLDTERSGLENATRKHGRLHVVPDVFGFEARQMEIFDHVVPKVAPDYTRMLATRLKARRQE